MDRHWLLTSTTYGKWLPGDVRGFVSNVRDGPGREVRHNIPGTPYDADMPGLRRFAVQKLRGPPVRFVKGQAEVLLGQFQETAAHRGWMLLAVAIMSNHVHLVVGVPGDPDPETLLRDFKSYGSRALNRRWSKPVSDTWWTESGSKRKLANEAAILAAVRYVIEQEFPLVLWTAPIPELNLAGGRLV
ncbi:MAG: transposase [Planctomycetes bacterium]|nr:transposase [Planctomycetota bacterium]